MPAGMHDGMKSPDRKYSPPPSESPERGGGQTTKEQNKAQKDVTKGIKQLLGSGNNAQAKVNTSQFLNRPNNVPMKTFPGLAGLALNLLQGPLQSGALANRKFYMDRVAPYQEIDFASLNPTQQEEYYNNYMSQRLAGETDAMGRTINNFGNDGGGGITQLQPETLPQVQQVNNTGINQLNPYVSGGEFIYGIPMGV